MVEVRVRVTMTALARVGRRMRRGRGKLERCMMQWVRCRGGDAFAGNESRTCRIMNADSKITREEKRY